MEKALVVGRNYCNILAVARLLGEAGVSCKVLKVHKTRPGRLNFLRTMAPESRSKYVESYREVIADEDNLIDVIIEMAEDVCNISDDMNDSACSRKMLLLPVDDYSVHEVDASLEKLSASYLTCSINGIQGAVNEMMDKSRQKKEVETILSIEANAADDDVMHPNKLRLLKSVLLEAGDEIPDCIKYPVFIKPNVSMKATKNRMQKCDSKEDLAKTLASYEDYSMLVEEYCDIKAEYSLLGFATGARAYAPAIFKAQLRGHRERKGVAITGQTLDIDKFAEVRKQCEKIVEKMGYIGVFDVDLMEDHRGNMYFVEINFRAGASIYAFSKPINLIGEFAGYMFHGKEFQNVKYEEGLTFVSEKVLMEEYVRGDISKKDFKRIINSSDIHFVKNEEDTAPFAEFKKYYFAADLLRLAYKFRG